MANVKIYKWLPNILALDPTVLSDIHIWLVGRRLDRHAILAAVERLMVGRWQGRLLRSHENKKNYESKKYLTDFHHVGVKLKKIEMRIQKPANFFKKLLWMALTQEICGTQSKL